tara:strand:- start:97683 stop:98624 length:942 start_codon:yes stop_codon:yes gene_type:complete
MTDMMFIDSNNIGFASQMTTKLTSGAREVQAIFGYLRSIRKIMGENPQMQPLSLWDGRAQWRYDLYPQYKGNRAKDEKMKLMREKYQEQRPDICRALHMLGVKQLTHKHGEADDLAGLMTNKAVAAGYRVLLVSGDKDWVQLVDDGVVWTDPIRNRSCTLGSFTDFTGCATQEDFVQLKALTGDNSDFIKGVGGIGDGTGIALIEQYGSVKNLLKLAEEGELPKKLPATYKRLIDNKPFVYRGNAYPGMQNSFDRNLKLMDLRSVEQPPAEELIIDRGEFNKQAFKEFCEELSFNSILRDLDGWVAPFEARQS